MSRFTKVVSAFGAGSVLLLSVGWQFANAQTPAQMEYERQQREYRQQQEQQRQDQQRLQQLQNDNARRQQEESNRAMRSSIPSSSPPQYPSTAVSPPSRAGGRPAQGIGTSERRYAVPGHGQFVAYVPRDWKEQLRQPPNREPPTIVFSPAAGNAFEVLLTPSWPEPKGRAPYTQDELRAAVGRGAQSAKAWALESSLQVKEIQGRSGPGFYFSATERAAKPGAHKYVTTGILRVGELSVPFTITSSDGQALTVQQALELLKSAAQEPEGVAAAASRTTPSVGTSAAAPTSTGTIRMNSYYLCNGERVAVVRCRSEADDAYCSVQYPDRKSAATGGITPELAEKRGELVSKLEKCQG
jgi:hypothetical protein